MEFKTEEDFAIGSRQSCVTGISPGWRHMRIVQLSKTTGSPRKFRRVRYFYSGASGTMPTGSASGRRNRCRNLSGPLHGLPWGLKDLFAVRGTKTTWGMTPYRDRVIDLDSSVYLDSSASRSGPTPADPSSAPRLETASPAFGQCAVPLRIAPLCSTQFMDRTGRTTLLSTYRSPGTRRPM